MRGGAEAGVLYWLCGNHGILLIAVLGTAQSVPHAPKAPWGESSFAHYLPSWKDNFRSGSVWHMAGTCAHARVNLLTPNVTHGHVIQCECFMGQEPAGADLSQAAAKWINSYDVRHGHAPGSHSYGDPMRYTCKRFMSFVICL